MTFNFHLILLCGAMAAMGIPLIYAQEVRYVACIHAACSLYFGSAMMFTIYN